MPPAHCKLYHRLIVCLIPPAHCMLYHLLIVCLMPPAHTLSCMQSGVWVRTVVHFVFLIYGIYCSKGGWVFFLIVITLIITWHDIIPPSRRGMQDQRWTWVTAAVSNPIFPQLTFLPYVCGLAHSSVFSFHAKNMPLGQGYGFCRWR